MGAQPPFLYDPPSRYSFSGPVDKPFNPRAATEASWSSPPRQEKRDGPLLSFSKHPDSYLIIPYGQTNVRPMSPSTKSRVKKLRGFQLALRLSQLLGMLGMLFCVIAIKNTVISVAWIIRVAPAVGILHTIYAVYHLCRAAEGRTPGSSASYMLFATTIDAGLIPFLAFTAILSRIQYTTGSYGWDTLFGTTQAAYWIVFATFVLSTAVGSLHVISLAIGIWLSTIFRKISKLPPDMNPLEDNLTARPHKRTKSEMTVQEKHLSQSSFGSSKLDKNIDVSDPLIPPPRTMPFMHTRNGSSDNLSSMHRHSNSMQSSRIDVSTPNRVSQSSPRSSRQNMTANGGGFYEQSNQSRSSRANIERPPSSRSTPPRPSSAVSRSAQSNQATPNRSSQLRNDWSYSSPNPPSPFNDENIRPLFSPHHQQTESFDGTLDIRDWYSKSPELKQQKKKDYLPVATQEPEKQLNGGFDFELDVTESKYSNGIQSPLTMNPPTPSLFSKPSPDLSPSSVKEPRRIALSDADVNLPDQKPSHQTSRRSNNSTSGSGPKRPSSFVGTGTKGKYYGEVLSLSLNSKNQSTRTNKTDYSEIADSISVYSNSDDEDEDEYSKLKVEALRPRSVNEQKDDIHYDQISNHEEYDSGANSPGRREADRTGRVVSNTGYDLNRGYAGLGPEFGRGMASRRRDVSGKLAEEGRALQPESTEREQDTNRTHGNVQSSGNKLGAAGWARFKGL